MMEKLAVIVSTNTFRLNTGSQWRRWWNGFVNQVMRTHILNILSWGLFSCEEIMKSVCRIWWTGLKDHKCDITGERQMFSVVFWRLKVNQLLYYCHLTCQFVLKWESARPPQPPPPFFFLSTLPLPESPASSHGWGKNERNEFLSLYFSLWKCLNRPDWNMSYWKRLVFCAGSDLSLQNIDILPLLRGGCSISCF